MAAILRTHLGAIFSALPHEHGLTPDNTTILLDYRVMQEVHFWEIQLIREGQTILVLDEDDTCEASKLIRRFLQPLFVQFHAPVTDSSLEQDLFSYDETPWPIQVWPEEGIVARR